MSERILVVEDDERSRRLLGDVLGFHGYRVTLARNGEEALAQAAAAPPDAALLDIQLGGGMNGFLLLEAMRATYGGIPLIAVTASVMEADRTRILEAGFDAYVPKPVNIRELLEILRDRLPRT